MIDNICHSQDILYIYFMQDVYLRKFFFQFYRKSPHSNYDILCCFVAFWVHSVPFIICLNTCDKKILFIKKRRKNNTKDILRTYCRIKSIKVYHAENHNVLQIWCVCVCKCVCVIKEIIKVNLSWKRATKPLSQVNKCKFEINNGFFILELLSSDIPRSHLLKNHCPMHMAILQTVRLFAKVTTYLSHNIWRNKSGA